MARLFLQAGETYGNVGGFSNTDGVGTNNNEKVYVDIDGKATFDPSFNRGGDQIVILGASEFFSGVRSGSALLLTSAAGASIRIPIGTAGTTITFNDGSAELIVTNNLVKLGGQTITTTAATLDGLFAAPPLAAEAQTAESALATHISDAPPLLDYAILGNLPIFG